MTTPETTNTDDRIEKLAHKWEAERVELSRLVDKMEVSSKKLVNELQAWRFQIVTRLPETDDE